MPIYEYVCSSCGHRTDILHGVNEAGPHFCPECGTEGSMRKAFAPPTILFKGTGWAKKERRSSSASGSSSAASKGDGSGGSSKSDTGSKADGGSRSDASSAGSDSKTSSGSTSGGDSD
jgi:putative FmdB family regulatory protein